MPALDWEVFRGLPGSPEANFEMLCRSLVRIHYARNGRFAARASQPGVEFHLKVNSDCTLGKAGQWFGWQCRWYKQPSGQRIGGARRNKIVDAIRKTEKYLPDITDWVLWTRNPLTSGDQTWFYGLTTKMTLHLWADTEVEQHLAGDAEILRETYFGDLVLTADDLDRIHKTSVAQIRGRWKPELHQTTRAERRVSRLLLDKDSWTTINTATIDLERDADAVEYTAKKLTTRSAKLLEPVVAHARTAKDDLLEIQTQLWASGDIERLRSILELPLFRDRPELKSLDRHLRAKRMPCALQVGNALASVRGASRIANHLRTCLDTRLIVVTADAGNGKTQLAAQVTASRTGRPAGVLLHGRDLSAGQSLDDLASRVTITGRPVMSMESLVAAINSAGQRCGRRLPLVIDALNEAEDPRDWKRLLPILDVILRRNDHVLGICTVRTTFIDEALPDGVERCEIPGFEHDVWKAIKKYFDYYKIAADDADLPIELLTHPLLLYLFCEVTNPTRQHQVGIEKMPSSLTALFDRYIDQVAQRASELSSRSHRFYNHDIHCALRAIGMSLWQERSRSLSGDKLRRELGDTTRPWNESILWALEQEGILLRVQTAAKGEMHWGIIYDALAGHLAADAILVSQGAAGFESWFREAATKTSLSGPIETRHPLAEDILDALVGLLPIRHRRQFWTMLEEPLRTKALHSTFDLDGAYLDSQTVEQLAGLVVRFRSDSRRRDPLERLSETRGVPSHPLNAVFLDTVLTPLGTAERDLRWSEWLRRNGPSVITDLKRLKLRWIEHRERTAKDNLLATWVMWTLTSTVRELRDHATRALYWYGRRDPAALFRLAIGSLAVKDEYVHERVLAASYGVVMAHQIPDSRFSTALLPFLVSLRDELVGSTAKHPTNHWLTRLHVQGIFSLAQKYYPESVPADLTTVARIPFCKGADISPSSSDTDDLKDARTTIRMDFGNYTLGRLCRNRRNYDMENTDHRNVVRHVQNTVWAHGWRKATHDAIDSAISEQAYMYRRDGPTAERYGKKYGWIGYYTCAGTLSDSGKLLERERLPDMQIDPSFPDPPPRSSVRLPVLNPSGLKDDMRWLNRANSSVPDTFLCAKTIEGKHGPWIMADGLFHSDIESSPRRVLFGATALLVEATDVDDLIRSFSGKKKPDGLWSIEAPSDYYIFAGEIPWCSNFAREDSECPPGERYIGHIEARSGRRVKVEILMHRYAWESYHSELNNASGALIPSHSFSAAFDLRSIPQGFHQEEPDGALAAMTFGAPEHFGGGLLYLREDLVYRYAAGRQLLWWVGGERQLIGMPDAKRKTRSSDPGYRRWWRVKNAADISRPWSVQRRVKQRRSRHG